MENVLLDAAQLKRQVAEIDGAGYKVYKKIAGGYRFADFELHIDRVQGDPFAAPTRVRVRIPQAVARYPATTYSTHSRHMGLCAYLSREFAKTASQIPRCSGSGNSGLIAIDPPGQQMLESTALRIDAEVVEVHFVVGLPAAGRRILGKDANDLLCYYLPTILQRSLHYASNQGDEIRRYTAAAEDADALRDQLSSLGAVAFVADGSVLPRRSGVDDRPLDEEVVPFRSPDSLRREVDLPNRGRITGMVLPTGVSLIVGGGFHGKSTFIDALSRGVYNHIPGDGRELAVTNADAVSIRAEDGRSVQGVDLSPFVNNLPFARNTHSFCTDNASGSTSQAANIVEALEVGARVLLIDEDTSASNFMIRDSRMQQLITRDAEPITPLIDRVRQLWTEREVSSIIVMGGSGDYFNVADTVIALREFVARDVTSEAKAIAAANTESRVAETLEPLRSPLERIVTAGSIDTSRGCRSVRIKSNGVRSLELGHEEIDLNGVEQIVHPSQTRAIAAALVYACTLLDGQRSMREIIERIMQDVENGGLGVLSPIQVGDHVAFRRHELAAALNRLRTLLVSVAV